MRIAAVYCIYNEEEFIEYSIRSVIDSVDRVIVLLGMAPWIRNNPNARQMFAQRDRTEEIVDRLAYEHQKIVVHKGLWDDDVQQRDFGMQRCIEEGMDYYFLIDGDELYRQDHLQFIREEIGRHPEVGTFHVKCTVLWRSFRYRIPYWGVQWIPWRIFKITRFLKLLGGGAPSIPMSIHRSRKDQQCWLAPSHPTGQGDLLSPGVCAKRATDAAEVGDRQ